MFEHRSHRGRGRRSRRSRHDGRRWRHRAPAVVAQDEAMPSCGTEPVELLAYFETGFPFQTALADEFSAQFPNVTWNIREDQFSNLIAQTPLLLTSDNPPDLIRLPTMVGLVRTGCS